MSEREKAGEVGTFKKWEADKNHKMVAGAKELLRRNY